MSGQAAYRASEADQAAWDRGRRPKVCKLCRTERWPHLVATSCAWSGRRSRSPGGCKHAHPVTKPISVSHETIYRSLFIQARGALKKELMAHLRRTRGMRRSRHHTQKTGIHGQIVDAASISERPRSSKIVRCLVTGKETFCSVAVTARSQRWLNARHAT